MNDRLSVHDVLVDILALRHQDPERALGRLNRAPSEFMARPEAKLVQAELVHQLQGPAAARPLLTSLVSAFPKYGSAYHLLGRVQAELGDEAGKVESYLLVHALDRVLDDALEERDVAELEQAMTHTAVNALAVAPCWVRARLAPVPIRWAGRPSREQVQRGFDPRALATLEAPLALGSPGAPLELWLYGTNLLASAHDEPELRANLRAAVRDSLARTA